MEMENTQQRSDKFFLVFYSMKYWDEKQKRKKNKELKHEGKKGKEKLRLGFEFGILLRYILH